MSTKIMTADERAQLRELDIAELDAVSGGALPEVIKNIIDNVACVTHGGDYFSNGTSHTCSGA